MLLEVESYVDVIFDQEKDTNRGVDMCMFSESVVLARDSEQSGWFLIRLVSTLKDEMQEDTS